MFIQVRMNQNVFEHNSIQPITEQPLKILQALCQAQGKKTKVNSTWHSPYSGSCSSAETP